MPNLNRRQFIRTTLAGAGAWIATGPWPASAATLHACRGSDRVPLGKTGLHVSRLAQGTGYNGWAHSSAQTRLGKAGFDRLLRHSLDSGINFIDMADLYGSMPFVHDIIKGLPRDKVVLLSKIWVRKETWNTPSGGAEVEVHRFLRQLGVDRLDVCLIHCMTDGKWATQYERVRDDLSKLKEQGLVRAAGVSCHDLGALKVAATLPWTDVIFARINNRGGRDYFMDGTVEQISDVLKLARRNGKAVVGIKIFGAGKLTKPEQKVASLKYVFSHELVDAISIGMLSPAQVDDTLASMSQVKVA